MKLSEAILLGSTVVTPKAGALYFSHENAGCALGMAAIASGCTFGRSLRQIPVTDLRTVNIEDAFGPWLLRVVMRPCNCGSEIPRPMRIKDIIAHLFDCHVKGNKNNDWTLDQLVAWVAGYEPTELAQNTFMAHAARRQRPQPQSPGPSDDAVEWQKTREAFEAKANIKRRRPTVR